MARPRLAALWGREEPDADLALSIGPCGPREDNGFVMSGDPPDDVLELIWERDGERIMAENLEHGPPCRRPWGYWRFVLGEEMPSGDAEAVRLAELGELSDEELAVLHERASEARTRIGTDREVWNSGHRPDCGCCRSIDQQRVDLWEMVEPAVRAVVA